MVNAMDKVLMGGKYLVWEGKENSRGIRGIDQAKTSKMKPFAKLVTIINIHNSSISEFWWVSDTPLPIK